jgi:hypothetical protein
MASATIPCRKYHSGSENGQKLCILAKRGRLISQFRLLGPTAKSRNAYFLAFVPSLLYSVPLL